MRLLKETAELAANDASAAFARLDDLYGKSSTPGEVLHLGTFAAHLGGSSLGQWNDTATYLTKLTEHPALALDPSVAGSVWRAIAVMRRCAGQHAEAEIAAQKGCKNPGDACRLSIMTGNTLASRNRNSEAVSYLRTAAAQARELDINDDTIAMTATVSGNLMKVAEQQARIAHELLLAVIDVHQASWERHADWQARHRACFQTGQALLLAAQPTSALAAVQIMMTIEDAHPAGPMERFFTATLACRAQIARGQERVARSALEACQDFFTRIESPEQQAAVKPLLSDLEALCAPTKKVVGDTPAH